MKISIIGAGPAGSYTACLLAKQGHDVSLIEEHNEAGKPVQCTGIVTASILKFFKLPKEVIANSCCQVNVISNTNSIKTNADEMVLYRDKFDAFLAQKAGGAGAKLLTGHRYISRTKNTITVKTNGKTQTINTDILIGADGPASKVAKTSNIPHNNKFYVGMQAKVKHKLDPSIFETHFGSSFPRFFGWVVPESEDTVRLGLGATSNAKELFSNYIKKVTGKNETLCWESGIIPIYNPSQMIQKDNTYLIGDAATQVKATTGGGIIPSLKAARVLKDCIENKKDYNTAYRWGPGKELWLHLKLRNILNRFTDKDYDHLLHLMNQNRINNLLNKYDRDSPVELLPRLLINEPRFLGFTKTLFQKTI